MGKGLARSAMLVAVAAGLASSGYSAWAQGSVVFSCGKPAGGQKALVEGSRYRADDKDGFGFDLVASPTRFGHGACSSDKPFFFSAAEPDGNYQVTVTLGSGESSVTTVRAESRRLFVDRERVPAGGSVTEVFNVNVRTDVIAGSGGATARVKLKPREIGALDWDEKLTLEFNGDHPGFHTIAIKPITGVPTIYLAGDSTVVDQDKEPWAAWGQMLPVFFGPGVVIANEAESGETIRSFTGELRFDKIMSTIKSGDYLMIQFAHNDQKLGSPEQTGFQGSLAKYVEAAKAHGAHPILVTAMNRRSFDAEGRIIDTLGGYPQATRAFAKEHNIPLIDLNAASKTLYETMGPDATKKAFVYFPANTFPEQPDELHDDTHFNAYGAYELARVVVQQIKDQHLPLEKYLRNGIPAFDPAHPDNVNAFVLPQSPFFSLEKPYGK
jgi:lysophospholipase L1-like esterase